MTRMRVWAAVALCLCLGVASGWAQELAKPMPQATPAPTDGGAASPLDLLEKAKKDVMKDIMRPDVLNTILASVEEGPGPLRLLKNLNLKFKGFEPSGANKDPGLGLEYNFDHSIARTVLTDEGNPDPIGMSFNIQANGNVAFNKDENPNDFLDNGVRLHLFQRLGRVDPSTVVEDSTVLQKLAKEASNIQGTPEQVDADPRWRAFQEDLESKLGTEYYWDVAGRFASESTQDFSTVQLAYGVQAGGVVRSWNRDSAWSKFNLIDWPGAAIRVLAGTDPEFTPTGRALPAALVGIDLVDPQDDKARAAVGEEDPYPRWRAEVAAKSFLGIIASKDVWLSMSYRHYQEIDASHAIRDANLDQQDYFVASVEMLGGVTVSYVTGKLPLDRKGDEVYELGFNVKF